MDSIHAFSDAPLTVGMVIFRIVLAVVFGGFIGLERGVRSHPAGFRTHILVCVGACLAMLTNQFVFDGVGAGVADPTRMGAQVISGIGFLGVGTIFMAGRNTVKGLTTAAGLWAAGAIGLAAGIGFYIGAIFATIIVLVVLGLLPAVESSFYKRARSLRLHVEFDSLDSEKAFVTFIRGGEHDIRSKNVESISNAAEGKRVTANYSIILKRGIESDDFIIALANFEGVRNIESQ